MKFKLLDKSQWAAVKEIYMEAFPKQERKPFFILKHSVKKGKAKVFVAMDGETLLGFVVAIPHQDMVMVDYLAVSSKIRSKGTGSFLMQEICKYYHDQKIVLLIERLDEIAENAAQRVARRRFYVKNGFDTSHLFVEGEGGEMEIMVYGGTILPSQYMELQKHALGNLLFRLSKMHLVS